VIYNKLARKQDFKMLLSYLTRRMTSEKEKPIYFVANLFFMLYIDLSQVGGVGWGVH